MKSSVSAFALVAGLLLAVAPTPSRAQDIGPVFDMSIIPTNAGLQQVEMAERKRVGLPDKYASKTPTTASASKARSTATATASTASFAYAPTAALRKQTVDDYLTQVRATNPAAATTLAAELAPGKTDYSALYHEINAGSGLKENDAADALATYLLMNWAVANDVRDDKAVTVAKSRGVRAQAAGILAGNDKLRAAGAGAAMGEQLKLNTVLLQVGWLRAIKDGTDAAYREKIAEQFQRQYHFDLAQMQLTDQGFVKQ